MDAARTDTQPHIFVSYRRTDKVMVLPIIRELERRGYRVWYDVGGITGGEVIGDAIQRHIEDCAAFLAFLSKDYNNSEWCCQEIRYAWEIKKVIIPVCLDDARRGRGLGVLLAGYHYISYQDMDSLMEELQKIPAFKECCIAVPTEPTPIIEAFWTLKNGLLTIPKSIINRKGGMPNFGSDDDTPWSEFRDKIERILIQPGVTNIGDSAFSCCNNLRIVAIPDSVTRIGKCAFSKCTSLTCVSIPEVLKEIGCFAFWGCTGLTSVSIPNSVTEIDRRIFSECTGLTNVTISDSVTKIGQCAFSNCISLTSIIIPNSVMLIEHMAFAYCDNLSTVYILGNPNSITIQDGAFYHAPAEIIYGPPLEDAIT